jgi:hypothetical protein
MHKLIFTLLASLSLTANAEPPQPERLAQYHSIHSSVGKFRFVLQNLESRPYSHDGNRAQVQISTMTDQPVQTIPVEINFAQPWFDFLDLNDDGYTDLLLYSSDVGGGSTALPDVFLYIPKLKKFVQSKTLSGLGEIIKSKNHGCVTVTYDRNTYGATTEEWCFNLDTGRWKMTKSERVTVGP